MYKPKQNLIYVYLLYRYILKYSLFRGFCNIFAQNYGQCIQEIMAKWKIKELAVAQCMSMISLC